MQIAAGWYPDPAGSGGIRYWDGTAWTPHVQPQRDLPAPASRPGRGQGRSWTIASVAVVVGVAVIVGAVVAVDHRSRSGANAARSGALPTSSPPSPTAAPPTSAPASRAKGVAPALVPYPVVAREIVPAPSSEPMMYSQPTGDTVVTPALARAIVSAMWARRATAIYTGDKPTLEALETGSALAVDVERKCYCGSVDSFGPLQSVTVGVPRFANFPAHFLAEVSTTLNAQPWVALLVMTRVSVDQPWRVAFSGGYPPAHSNRDVFRPLVGADGYTPAPAAGITAFAVQEPAALAAYWQSWKDTGAAPPVTNGRQTSWIPGAMTTDYGGFIARSGLQGQVNAGNGLVGRYRYGIDPSVTPFVFPLRVNELLVCAPIMRQATWTSPTGEPGVEQPADSSAWGPEIAPGVYRAVQEDDVASSCIDMYDAAGGLTNAVFGVQPDGVTVVGIR